MPWLWTISLMETCENISNKISDGYTDFIFAFYLKIIHELGIVHGDLHGGNVLVKNDPAIKGAEIIYELRAIITDFGYRDQ